MPLHIIDPKAETLASELARKAGESIPEAVIHALAARLDKLREKERVTITLDAIMRIAERCKNLPDLDRRSPDEILGYDKAGLVARSISIFAIICRRAFMCWPATVGNG